MAKKVEVKFRTN